MPDNSIYTTLSGALAGSTLTLTPATFGSGGIADVLAEYFPVTGTLVIDGVQLHQDGEAVTFSGATGRTAPLAGTAVAARFAPGAAGAEMTLTATPPSGWLFSTGWPLLAGGSLDQLTVTNATLTLSSVAVPGGTAKGITFAGTIGFPGLAANALLWLVHGSTEVQVTGPVGQRGTAPSFAFSAPVGTVNMPVLGSLAVSFAFSSTPVSGAVQPQDGLAAAFGALTAAAGDPGPWIYPWVPNTTLGVGAQITIGGAAVPIFVDLSLPDGLVPIVADVSQVSAVGFRELAAVLAGHDLSVAMPSTSVFDPGQYFMLRTLSFTLDPVTPALRSAGLTLGTTKAWPVTQGVSVGPVSLIFLVDFAGKQVFGSVTGDIGFPGGSLGLSASYPDFVFAGGLNPGSTIDLSALLSTVLSGTSVPTLTMDRLDFVVHPLNGGSFSLVTGLTGNWSVPVGPATLALTGAYLELDRQAGGSAAALTSGTIAAQAVLTPPPQAGEPITFDATWTLPGTFSLTGKAPALHLTDLAAKVTGTPVPAGVPQVDLTNGQIAIVLDSKGDYALAVSAEAAIGTTTLGDAVFAVRRTPTTFGFLIGVVVEEGWSPAQVWPDLATVFGHLTFTRSGLLVSTLPANSDVNLPALTMPSVPAKVSPGLVFFSTLALEGPILGPLAELFDRGVTLDLLAVVDTSAPANSLFQAIFSGNSQNKEIAWTQVVVTIAPAATRFSVRAAATFTIQGEKLTLSGDGTITLEPPAARFTLLIENWQHPFGIENLVVTQFGLQIGYEEGVALTIGLCGSFKIGTGARTFTLVIGAEIVDFEAPGALIFELQNNDKLNPLMLSDVIHQFTNLDVSSVPVLNALGFNYLQFAVVDDPAGFTIGTYHFPPGIGIAADIFLYSWEAAFSIQVSAGTGIYASGHINAPISLGGIFTLSDTSGKTGPSGLIDTSHLPARTDRAAVERWRDRRALGGAQPYFTLDGKVSFLGINTAVKAAAAGTTFDFELDFAFLDAVTAHLGCHLIDAKHFSASAEVTFNLDVDVGPYSAGGITLIPHVRIQSTGAGLALAIAINPQVIAQLTLVLQFSWLGSVYSAGFTLSVADITSQLTNLWPAIKTWMQHNAQVVFHEILSDAVAWVQALLGPFAELARDVGLVADALANYFAVSVEDAAALLTRLGYPFLDIVNALVEYFKVSFDDAANLVESLVSDCGMQTAEEQAYGMAPAEPGYTVRDIAFELTGSPGGQRLLEIWYCHRDEIETLLTPHPYLHDRLRSFATSNQRARDMRLMADTAVKAIYLIAPEAGPELAACADELIPMLMRYRDMSAAAALADLAAQR